MSLTDDWRAKKLRGGWYFVLFTNHSTLPVYYDTFNQEFEFNWNYEIQEVLVPCDYEELQRLKEENHKIF